MAKYGAECISATYIPYGRQVCKHADGDGLAEVCDRQIEYHKVYYEEHAIHVDNFSKCLTITEDYKMTKSLEIGPLYHG